MSNQYSTHDMSFAAYLLMSNVKMESASVELSGRFNFKFGISEEEAERHKNQFLSSSEFVYDRILKELRAKIREAKSYGNPYQAGNSR